VEVWQTFNLRWLRFTEEKKKEEDEEGRINHMMKI